MTLHRRAKDLTGKKYGLLTVGEPTSERKYTKVVWNCTCECGGTTTATSGELNDGKKSCGCLLTRPLEQGAKVDVSKVTIIDPAVVLRIVEEAKKSGTTPDKWACGVMQDWIMEHRSGRFRGDQQRFDARAHDTTAEYFD